MSSPLVESGGPLATPWGNSSTAPIYDLPAGIESGDLLFAKVTVDGDAVTPISIVWPAGWTPLYSANGSSNRVATFGAWRDADGASDGISVSPTLSLARKSCALVYRISGAMSGAIQSPYWILDTTQGSVNNPNPPNLAPGAGALDYLALTFAPADTYSISLNSPPSGYINEGALQSGSSGAQCTLFYAEKALSAALSEDPGPFDLSSTRYSIPTTILIAPAEAGGSGIPINEAASSNFGEKISPHKSVQLFAATQSNQALAINSGRVVSISVAAETSEALLISPSKAALLSTAEETSTAETISPDSNQIVSIGEAVEVNSGDSVSIGKLVSLKQSAEINTAEAITASSIVNAGVAVETNTALVVALSKWLNILAAIEADLALPISPESSVLVEVGASQEIDVAEAIQALSPAIIEVGVAAELDTAEVINPEAPGLIALNPGLETDQADSIQLSKIVSIDVAQEASAAESISVISGASVSAAEETDSAESVSAAKIVQIGVAFDSSQAENISALNLSISQPALENNISEIITPLKRVLITPALESDSASEINVIAPIVVAINTGAEVDVAGSAVVVPLFVQKYNVSGTTLAPGLEVDLQGGIISELCA